MTDFRVLRDIARALDRFRWRQLRKRHGRVGSAMRLLRDMLIDSYYGLRARLALDTDIRCELCDILLLQSTPQVIGLQRKRLLKAALMARGYRLVEAALDEPGKLVEARCFIAPIQTVPLRYHLYLAHAEWLVAKYAPRILLNDRNGSLYSPFLRYVLNRTGSLLVQLAHATTVEKSRRLDMNDYDFYFLFGRSSLEALQRRPLRFGTSNVVLTGSHMIDRSYDLMPAKAGLRSLLILGVGPDKEKESGYQQTYCLLRTWVAENPSYSVLIKAHPRSKVPFWHEAALTMQNLSVLPQECSLAMALEQASVVVNIMSNAVIEAALASRPVVFVNTSSDIDIFLQERFLGGRQMTVVALQDAIRRIEANYDKAIQDSKALAEYHLAHGSRGLEITVEALQSLIERSALPESIEQFKLSGTP